jgi:GT2 family glycosyltransferase
MDISVIIVNWNSRVYVQQCLTSLFAHYRGDELQVIVVDSASFDGCGEMLARDFPSVQFIQSPHNIGFARANNMGARYATGSYLLLLNPDMEFIEDSLSILRSYLESLPGADAVGCRLLNRDRTLQISCVQSFPTFTNQLLGSRLLQRWFPRSSLWGISALYRSIPSEVEMLSGACILLRRDCFDHVGGFTESYFMYAEDLDLCFKLHRNGYKIFHVPATSIIHFGGGSTGKAASNFSAVMMRASLYHFMHLHHGIVAALAYRTSMAISAALRLSLIGPVTLIAPKHFPHSAASFHKWLAILQWSFGLGNYRRPTAG